MATRRTRNSDQRRQEQRPTPNRGAARPYRSSATLELDTGRLTWVAATAGSRAIEPFAEEHLLAAWEDARQPTVRPEAEAGRLVVRFAFNARPSDWTADERRDFFRSLEEVVREALAGGLSPVSQMHARFRLRAERRGMPDQRASGRPVAPTDSRITTPGRTLTAIAELPPPSSHLDENDVRPILPVVSAEFHESDASFEAHREQTRARIDSLLKFLAGRTFPDFATKQSVTVGIRNRLRRAGLAVVCPKCGQQAILDIARSGRSRGGNWVFRHGPRTHSAPGGRFPVTHVLPAAGTATSRDRT